MLARLGVTIVERRDARKRPIRPPAALALLREIDDLYVTRGAKVRHLPLSQLRPPAPELLTLVIGPTGILRAPVVRRGRTLVVGFDHATYQRLFG